MKQLRPSQETGLEGSRLYMQSIEILIVMTALQDDHYCFHIMAFAGVDISQNIGYYAICAT